MSVISHIQALCPRRTTKIEQKRLYLISKFHRHKYFLHPLEDQDITTEGRKKVPLPRFKPSTTKIINSAATLLTAKVQMLTKLAILLEYHTWVRDRGLKRKMFGMSGDTRVT